MDEEIKVDFDALENAGILGYLGSAERIRRSVSAARDQRSCAPGSVKDPYLRLGCHPDLVERLWKDLTVSLPMKCAWIVYGVPVLVHPSSGIIFGFCGGTHMYSLRLPPEARAEAIQAGAERVFRYPAIPRLNKKETVFDLDTIGKEWVFGKWFKDEAKWCQEAFNFAARN
jgi:hypothetical protein